MKRVIDIVIDLQNKIYNTVFLKQMDTTIIKVKLLDNNTIANLESQMVDILFTKPDNTIVQQLSTDIDEINGIATIPLLEDCVRQPGKAKMEIEVKKTNSEVISSFYIPVQIEKTSKENVNSENTPNYFEEFAKAIDDFKSESKEMLQDISDAEDIRITNENNRISAETERIEAEENRVIEEEKRISAEQNRKKEFEHWLEINNLEGKTNEYVPRKKEVTLSSTNWVLNEETNKYEYIIADDKITENDFADFVIHEEDKSKIKDTNGSTTENAQIIIRTSKEVTEDVHMQIVLIRTVAETNNSSNSEEESEENSEGVSDNSENTNEGGDENAL